MSFDDHFHLLDPRDAVRALIPLAPPHPIESASFHGPLSELREQLRAGRLWKDGPRSWPVAVRWALFDQLATVFTLGVGLLLLLSVIWGALWLLQIFALLLFSKVTLAVATILAIFGGWSALGLLIIGLSERERAATLGRVAQRCLRAAAPWLDFREGDDVPCAEFSLQLHGHSIRLDGVHRHDLRYCSLQFAGKYGFCDRVEPHNDDFVLELLAPLKGDALLYLAMKEPSTLYLWILQLGAQQKVPWQDKFQCAYELRAETHCELDSTKSTADELAQAAAAQVTALLGTLPIQPAARALAGAAAVARPRPRVALGPRHRLAGALRPTGRALGRGRLGVGRAPWPRSAALFRPRGCGLGGNRRKPLRARRSEPLGDAQRLGGRRRRSAPHRAR